MTPYPQIKKDYLTLAEVTAECNVQLDDLRYFGEEGKLAICLRHIKHENGRQPYSDDDMSFSDTTFCFIMDYSASNPFGW